MVKKKWLVKFNPGKTDIMVFSANNQQNDLTFDFNPPTLEIASLIITLWHLLLK
jgi:hypothetical protein